MYIHVFNVCKIYLNVEKISKHLRLKYLYISVRSQLLTVEKICIQSIVYPDLKSLNKSGGKFGITGSPRGDNLFLWDVELMDFEKGTLLYKDLESYAKKHNRKVCVESHLHSCNAMK